MALLDIHPAYREMLARLGMSTADDFLALQGVVCCGHLDRHVAQVSLGTGPETVRAFLKREHRTRRRDRWASAMDGFGFVSKSRREFAVLRQLEATDIGGPVPIAAGEDEHGRAFLLVREEERCQDLRQALGQIKSPAARRNLARQLGAALARMHRAGFMHPDLYSKHVLVRQNPTPGCHSICILDWQRVQRRTAMGWARRWRNLAALDATVADELASPHERLLVLNAYLRGMRTPNQHRSSTTLGTAACEIRRRSKRLLERRRIQEIRQPPLAPGTQNLIWLDGEALQVTREFRDELGGNVPAWLNAKKVSGTISVKTVPLPGPHNAELVTRSVSRPWRTLWCRLWRQPLVAPELESMKMIFRLERYGVTLPRLLAAGQETVKPWQIQSFLLTEPLKETVPLPHFLREADQATRREVIRRAGHVLRQMHRATCYVKNGEYQAMGTLLTVRCHEGDHLEVALANVHSIAKSSCPNPVRARRDLAALVQALDETCTRTDILRGFLGYIDQRHQTPIAKRFALRVLERMASPNRRRRVAA
jgi:tRNA A-37 threonylcarbamoyl transferase component Bud32